MLRKGPKASFSDEDRIVAETYWSEVANCIPEWQEAIDGTILPSELRETKIHAHGGALQSLGNLGSCLLENYPKSNLMKVYQGKNFETIYKPK